ncbi:hypothetical protein ACROSR_07360, partial [Roseovarius tibetensis]|uniref:hypothetical protein n=1 Tax=Roseovarius tibetensis TaxID=2685897 RepID=UPI003D7FD3C6
MTVIQDIKDEHSLRVWLEDQPREVSVWIASRAAARLLPVWWDSVLIGDWADEPDFTALPVLRNLLISSVAVFVPHDDIKSAAQATVDRADAATSKVASATSAGISQSNADPISNATAEDATAGTCYAVAYGAACAACAAEDAHAAYAAVTAARAATDATAWRAIRSDAERASERRLPDALPLWPDGLRFFGRAWSYIKAQVAASPDAADWQFWLDWYDAQVAGRTMLPDSARTWDMLEKIALIDPATWDAGPEVVNPVIREIWEGYRAKPKIELFKATLYDFRFDQMAHVMRAVPMPEDWETLTDPDHLQRFLNDALDLREDMNDLRDAFEAEGTRMQGAGMTCTYLSKVLEELENAETVGALRVGKLVEWGRILEATALREDTKREFGPMAEPFSLAVDKLKGLVRDHFAHTLARFSQLRDIRLEADASPWEVLKELRDIVANVRSGAEGALPPLDGTDAAVLDDILDSIDRMVRELDQTSGEDARSGLKREIDFQMAKVAATAGLYGEKARKAASVTKTGGETADEILKWEKRGTDGMVAALPGRHRDVPRRWCWNHKAE